MNFELKDKELFIGGSDKSFLQANFKTSYLHLKHHFLIFLNLSLCYFGYRNFASIILTDVKPKKK